MTEESLQRSYYSSTAQEYDQMHVSAQDEHSFALAIMAALIKFHRLGSVLDVGSGTGRALFALKEQFPELRCVGVEPVAELREVGHAKGLDRQTLVAGRGDQLTFESNSFDVVCEFAVLHHVPQSRAVIEEMCRVARKMVVVSDCNFVAQGSPARRYLKRFLFGLHLWPLVRFVKTGGKGYSVSSEDGIQYSYSVFQDIDFLRKFWKRVLVIPTQGDSANDGSALLGASQVLLVCLDKR